MVVGLTLLRRGLDSMAATDVGLMATPAEAALLSHATSALGGADAAQYRARQVALTTFEQQPNRPTADRPARSVIPLMEVVEAVHAMDLAGNLTT